MVEKTVEDKAEDTTENVLAILLLHLGEHSRKDLGEPGFWRYHTVVNLCL